MVEKVYTECDNLTTQAKKGLLENKPRCNQEQTLEVLISSVLSKVHDEVRKICMTELSHHNAPLIMVTCGLKGFIINISGPLAATFPKKVQLKGFVHNSFYTGLLPTEFLFHTISGHEGLVDMVVNTAETGYMQCQLMKALEDLMTLSAGGTVQFRHGDDGLDPTSLKGDAPPIEFEFFIDNAVYPLAMLCKACGMFEVLECFNEWDSSNECIQYIEVKSWRLSWVKYVKARIELGEPGTQMTLKTFQFAGVTSMNVILSVPCIKETINTTKAISTPIISSVLEEAWTPKHTHISVIIDMEAISKL
ncbi:hypothetical protein J3A83DRAFT_4186012 [Scleroderma citrinum]